ncbi:MAG TPA: ferritin-like protein [Acidimicrobiales bacterium]|nr:ferritin-like protein [Acidimicrobiales bacterium]
MDDCEVRTLADLRDVLQAAVELELATIPPYLCAWWTVRDRTCEVALMLQDVAIAEMRHLAIAANTLIAVGGTPEIRAAFPAYPTHIRNVGTVEVSLLPFGRRFLEQSRRIERPETKGAEPGTPTTSRVRLLAMGDRFSTIGAFYRCVLEGLDRLVVELGEPAVFPDGGRIERQLGYFGAQRIDVACRARARALLDDVVDEGEGDDCGVRDRYGALAHFYTFDQMCRGRRYGPEDKAGRPCGDELAVPEGEEQVAPMLPNATQLLYLPPRSALWDDSVAFNDLLTDVVDTLDAGFKGDPAKVQAAFGLMLQLREAADRLLARPLPDHPGQVAGPTFELSCAPR